MMEKIIVNTKIVLAEAEKGLKRAVSLVIPACLLLVGIDVICGTSVGVVTRILSILNQVVTVLAKLTGKGTNVTVIILVIAFIIISLRKTA